MKGIAVILALIIFSTSLKASAFTNGVVGAIKGDISSYSCCQKSDDSDVKECDSSEQNQGEDDCCKGSGCHCTCCLHIAYLQSLSFSSISSNDFSGVKFGYTFLYHADYFTSVFHPPSYL